MHSNLLMLATAAAFVGAGGGILSNDTRPAAASDAVVADTAAAPVAARTAQAEPPTALKVARAVLAGVGSESAARKTDVQVALETLGAHVSRQSHPNALRLAFQAYFNYKAENPEDVRKPYLYYVDYGLNARTPRGYVFDMERLTVVDGPFTVAHGRGSAATSDGIPTRFSNREGSNATSLGLFLAQETYGFSGKAGGRVYRSIGLRLRGLSGRFNSAARQRRVVAHGAPYVTATKAGRSEGCPAMEPDRAQRLLPRIGNGGLVFLFSPLDPTWMREDPWAATSGRLGMSE